MIRFFSVIMFCFCLSKQIVWAKKNRYEHKQIFSQTIQKLVETEESFEQAEKYYLTLNRTADVKGDERMQAECLLQLARIHYWQAQYSLSLEKTKRALAIAHRLDDKIILTSGYELLGRLHYMLSPEQAQYYYRKCWQYCEQSDSTELAVLILNNFNLSRKDREIVLNELLTVDMNSLSSLNQARLSYNIVRSLIANGRADEAIFYLDNVHQYLQQNSEKSPINAMYEHRMGEYHLLKGNTKQAWEHVHKSMTISRKNKIMIGMIHNYNLASQIAQSENKDHQALVLYKKSVMLRDSMLNCPANMFFLDELIYTMMDYIADDRAKAANKNYKLIVLWTGLILIAGAGLLYYFKSTGRRKKSNTALENIRDHTTNRLHSRMKNHLMKITYGYKLSVNDNMKKCYDSKKPELADIFTDFENHKKKFFYLMDSLFSWMESNPEMTPEKVEFNVTETIKQVVAFFKIAFAHKSITCQLFAEQTIMIRGDRHMLIIAMEHLFSNLFKAAAENAVVNVSVSEIDRWYVAIKIADSGNKEKTIEKEIFAQRITELETTGILTHTADRDFNIFAECTLRNHSKTRMECTPEKGTVYYYVIPT